MPPNRLHAARTTATKHAMGPASDTFRQLIHKESSAKVRDDCNEDFQLKHWAMMTLGERDVKQGKPGSFAVAAE